MLLSLDYPRLNCFNIWCIVLSAFSCYNRSTFLILKRLADLDHFSAIYFSMGFNGIQTNYLFDSNANASQSFALFTNKPSAKKKLLKNDSSLHLIFPGISPLGRLHILNKCKGPEKNKTPNCDSGCQPLAQTTTFNPNQVASTKDLGLITSRC